MIHEMTFLNGMSQEERRVGLMNILPKGDNERTMMQDKNVESAIIFGSFGFRLAGTNMCFLRGRSYVHFKKLPISVRVWHLINMQFSWKKCPLVLFHLVDSLFGSLLCVCMFCNLVYKFINKNDCPINQNHFNGI